MYTKTTCIKSAYKEEKNRTSASANNNAKFKQ